MWRSYIIKFPKVILLFILLLLLSRYGKAAENIQDQIEQQKALVQKYKAEDNKIELAKVYTKLGYLYWQISAQLEAINYFTNSVNVNETLGNKNALKTLYNNLGLLCSEREEYQKAIDYFSRSLEINLAQGNKAETISDYLNIALSFQSIGYYAESNSRAKKALEKALEINNLELAKNAYGILGENFEKLGDDKAAADNFEKFNSLAKHLQKLEMEKMADRSKQFEEQVHSKEKELKTTLNDLGEAIELNREMQLQNALLNKENQLNEAKRAQLEAEQQRLEAKEKTRQTQIFGLSAVLALFVLIIILVYFQFRAKKKANRQLHDQNIEIEKQKEEISKQHDLAQVQKKRITDSIQYAQRIQKAVLPPVEAFDKSFNDYFILYRPKDIVSGDFYWTTRKDNVLILAVADCTGHGVPGAFMSMLGVAFLNEIVNKIAINKHISTLNADDILNQLRDMVITSLHQTGDQNEPKDGMDIALVIIDFEKKKLQYAGANSPLYLIRKGELMQYNPDKMPVSYHQKRDIPFTGHQVDWQPDDIIYLFTDGYIDQFGGKEGMKFMAKKFKEVLCKISTKPMAEQATILQKTFDDWRGEHNQLDDVLVIGIQLAARLSTRKAGGQINWQNKTILIAEDTDMNYFLLTAVLKNTMANLIRVKDGQEAVDFVRNNEVDLVLMDINMPRMNGYDATRAIKQLRSDIPIIVQTAMHFDEESDEAYNAGADDYIAKPIDLKTFMNKIERFLS